VAFALHAAAVAMEEVPTGATALSAGRSPPKDAANGTGRLLAALSQASVTSILGPESLSAIKVSEASKLGSKASSEIAVSADVINSVFEQMLKVITELEGRMQSNESHIDELQAKQDSIDSKCRSWRRQVERADHDLVDAEKRRDESQVAAKRARMEVTPLIERFMEAEVLRNKLDSEEEELKRLHKDIDTCENELAKGLPRLSQAEIMESELSQAVIELETAHMEEMATLRALHLEEVSDLRVQHATCLADIESSRLAEVSNAKITTTEDLGKLRSALQEVEWQSDVFVREQEDAIRELCIKQRDNARLAKRNNEVRQEALDLSVRWEAAAPPSVSSQDSQLHIAQQRCALLQRTASEWREALRRKSADCDRWRERAAKRGIDIGPDEPEDTFVDLESLLEPASPQSVTSTFGANGTRLMSSQVPFMDLSNISPSAAASPRTSLRADGPLFAAHTPARTPKPVSMQSGRSTPATSQHQAATRHTLRRNNSAPGGRLQQLPRPKEIMPKNAIPSNARRPLANNVTAFPWDFIEKLAEDSLSSSFAPEAGLFIPEPASAETVPISSQVDSSKQQRSYVGESAHEYFAVALRAAQVWAEAEATGRGTASHDPDTAAGETPEVSSPSADLVRKLSAEVQEVENELEMLSFLMNEGATIDAEKLLEQQARHQPSPVAKRLRHHLEALVLRRKRR
jgi:hypothetical protein